MKKKLNLVLVLLLVAANGLWAQGLQLSGSVNSGLGVINSSIENSDTILKLYGVDSEQNGYQLKINGAYQNTVGNAGARLSLQSQNKIDAGYISLPYAYGWAKFGHGIFYTSAGIISDNTWNTGDWWINDHLDSGLGTLLKATPLDGLDFGFGAYVISTQAGGNNNVLGDGKTLNFGEVEPKIGDVKYVFSGSYTMQDMFRVGASYRNKNKAAYDERSLDAPKKYEGNAESSRFLGELRFLMFPDLTAVAVVSLDKLEDFKNKGDIVISETFAYAFGDMNIGLNAVQFFYNRGDDEHDPGLLFNLWGSYTIGTIVPRLDIVYFLGGQSTLGGSGSRTWNRRGFIGKLSSKGEDDDYSVFSVRPSLRFNLDSNTFIEMGNKLSYDFANFNAYRKDGQTISDTLGGDIKHRLTNVFYIDFKWSF